MRRTTIHVVLLAVAASMIAANGVAQQPSAMTANGARSPQARLWSDMPHRVPQMRPTPVVEELPVESPRDERFTKKKEIENEPQPATDTDVMMLAVWSRGLWAMPPGGMTRGWCQPPIPINPESTLASARTMPQ